MSRLVLVVEDKTILGASIRGYLERHAHATSVARSGEEALRFAERMRPDVAVMDIRLPGMDGLEALQVAGWNRVRAARLLGIFRETLRYRIEKHQLQAAF